MKALVRFAVTLAIAALAVWLWTVLFPSPEKQIRNQLAKIERFASFDAPLPPLTRGLNAERLGALFAENVQITIGGPNHEPYSFTSRQELMQAALAAQSKATRLKVQILQPRFATPLPGQPAPVQVNVVHAQVKVAKDSQSATVSAYLVAEGDEAGGMRIWPIKIAFQKIDGRWEITSVRSDSPENKYD